MIPAESRITRVMENTGMGRLQAIRHLQARDQLADMQARQRMQRSGGLMK